VCFVVYNNTSKLEHVILITLYLIGEKKHRQNILVGTDICKNLCRINHELNEAAMYSMWTKSATLDAESLSNNLHEDQ
jgi:hypothetical protein